MIVVGNKDMSSPQDTAIKHADSLEDMFRKEIDAYCAYNDWRKETKDTVLEMALEEIMMDEYLHARFLRDYMMDKQMYVPKSDDLYEKKFWKIQEELFED